LSVAILTFEQRAGYAYGAGFRGDAVATIVAISEPESGGDTNARALTEREDSRGWLQINTKAHPQYDPERLYEPAYCAAAAYTISAKGSNFRPWTAYTSGAYRSHLEKARVAAIGAGGPGSSITPPGTVPAGGLIPGVPLVPGAGGFLGDLLPEGFPAWLSGGGAGLLGQVLDVDRIFEQIVIVGMGLVFTAAGLALAGLGLARMTDTSPREAVGKVMAVQGTAGLARTAGAAL
jgi:hypothetical protein